ncbi:phytoene desaturase family protein [Crocinitomix sp.]|nr:phytoene desaturase family protein [Crocinitomix sp.]
MKKNAIIIGAGLGGLAASIRLNAMGYEVTVLEKNDTFGGKLRDFEWNGYRWDNGPSLFTLPNQVDELFALAGKNPKDYFDYHTMDHSCHYYFQDGTNFLIKSDEEQRNKDLVEHFNSADGNAAIEYITESSKTYEAIGDLFIDHPKYTLKNVFDRALLKQYPKFLSRKLTGSLHQLNERKFTSDNLVRIFDRYATYNGSNPYKMSGLYSMVTHLEMNDGTYFPKKGMRSIVQSIYQLANDIGVKFIFNQSSIKATKKDTGGYVVNTDQDNFEATILISAIDVVNFYDNVLEDKKLAAKYAAKERSASALVFYWAVEKVIPEVKLHNIYFGEDYQEEFTNMFDRKKVTNKPTVYLHVSSTVNPEDAPENGQNWFVMINLTAGMQVTDEERDQLRKHVYSVIKDKYDIDISPYIKHEEYWESADIESITGAYKGALYGASSNSKLAALTRHGNSSKKYKDLYFCGGTVHPGGGIPLVLKSAKIVGELIRKSDG